jgi:inosose dehydratase
MAGHTGGRWQGGTRRDLLRGIVAGVVVSARGLDAFQRASPTPKRIRWAMGWLLWRDYKPRKIALAEALEDLRAVGADGIEFTPRPGELEAAGLTIDGVKQLLETAGLALSGQYFSAPFHEMVNKDEILRQAREKFDSLRVFGARNLVLGPPAPPAGGQRLEAIKRMAPVLNELGRRAASQGIAIGVHPHLNTVIQSPEETDAIMDATDPKLVGLALDTGHCYLAGGDPARALQKHGARLNYLHFKDAVRPFKSPDFLPNLRELGSGEIDFPAVMRELAKRRYAGWIDVEQDFTTSTPRESCQTSMRYARDVLSKIYA